MDITQKGIQKIASIRVINRTLSMVNTLVRSTSEVFRGNSQRNMPTFQKEGVPNSPNVHEVNDENYRFTQRENTVKFAEVPNIEGEDPPPHITRNNSLARMTSALRNVHRRTASLTDRTLAQAQEIPYTELDDLRQSNSSDSSGNSNPSTSNNTTSQEISGDSSSNLNISKDANN